MILCPWDFPGKNTGVGCHFLLQGIFQTQGSNPCLLHWQVNSFPLSHHGSPESAIHIPISSPFWISFPLDHHRASGRVPCAKQKVLIQLFSSVAQSCPILCEPLDCCMPDLPVHHQLPELAQTHVHRVSDAIQPACPLSSPSPPALNLSHHQGLF